MTQTALNWAQVINAEPGIDLNVMVAEHLFKWHRISGSTHDYDGPVEHGEVLIPPTMSEANAYAMMPPRGRIPLSYFIQLNWSKDISAAWFYVEGKIRELGLQTRYYQKIKEVVGRTGELVYPFDYIHATPEQRCKAALLAVLDL